MSGVASAETLRCPVCTARLRNEPSCGRCGADLSDFLRTQLAAWRARHDGWRRLASGDPSAALAAAERSSAMAATPAARRLAWLCRALLDGSGRIAD